MCFLCSLTIYFSFHEVLQNKPKEISQIKQSSKLLGIEWRWMQVKSSRRMSLKVTVEEMRSIHEWSSNVKMTFKISRSQILHGLTVIKHTDLDYDSWPQKERPGAPFRYGCGTKIERAQALFLTLFPIVSATGLCWRQDTALKENLLFPMRALFYDTYF